ncbi:MAG TPA: cupredoxin domain-containing protein [Candidatus Rokubacteria bacterium]|nr:cupredoxin domain-containing protein [Candidatus Rokubacteria bacterium]
MKNKRPQTRPSARWKRRAYYLVIAASIAGVAWVLAPSFGGSQATRPPGGDVAEIKGTMSGFSTAEIRAKAGRPLTVRLTSVDTRFHTDGGGKHQFAIDALGVNIIAPPEGTREATFTPPAGVYDYYCDVCCGGKANPTMRGKLIVES